MDFKLNWIKRIPRYMLYMIAGFAVFMFMFTYVKPELAYFLQQIGFTTSEAYLHEMLGFPGGPAEYISIFLFQYSIKSYTGSIVYGVLFFTLLFLTDRIFHRRRSAIDTFLVFGPAIITVMLMIDYTTHPVFPILAIALFFAAKLGLKILGSKMNQFIRLGLLILLLAIFYYVTGGFAFLVLCFSLLLWSVFSLKLKESYPEMIALIVFGGLIPYIAPHIFFITQKDAYMHLVPYFCSYKPGHLLYASMLSLPAILFLQLPVRFRLKNLHIQTGFLKSEWLQLIQTVLMIGVLIYCLFYNFKEKIILQHKIEIDKLAYERKWDDLLTLANDINIDDRETQFQVNRALYFTGELTEKLFDYSQQWGLDGLFLTRYFSDDMLLPSTELFFDLGFMNEAIHYANEAIAQKENSPFLLEQLILANIVSGKNEAAQLYTNVLKDFPVFEEKAKIYNDYLKGVNIPEIEKLIKEKRAIMPTTDFKVNRKSPTEDMLNLLADHPQNKMAYEYLMAGYLLDNDVASFIKYYSIGRRLNYTKIPTLFQQALVLYSYELSRKGRSMGNLRLDKDILNDFNEYISILSKYKGNKDEAATDLSEQFGNTYWFYVHYNSPATNTKKE